MKNWKYCALIGIVAIIVVSFVGCPDPNGNGDKDLAGTITITPTSVATGTELTAVYSGSEAINYQWNKGESAIGGQTNSKYTTNEAGSYTVTISLAGYNSKTSTAVTVTALLTGNVEITGKTVVGQTLTATMTGTNGTDEGKRNYQWTRDGENIGAGANGKNYTVVAGDVGATLGVRIGYEGMTGTRSGTAELKATRIPRVFDKIEVTGDLATAAHVTTIEAAIDDLETWARPHMNYIREHLEEFRVISGDGGTRVEMGIARISVGTLGNVGAIDEISYALYAYAGSQGISLQLNNSR